MSTSVVSAFLSHAGALVFSPVREASSCPRVVLAFPMSDTANTSSFFVPSSFSNF